MKMQYLFFICIIFTASTVIAQPANDNCSSSQNLVRQVGNSCSSSFTATTVAATQSSQPAIGNSLNTDDDIWFDFTLGANQTAGIIRFSNFTYTGTNNGIVMQLWLTDCSTSQPFSKFTGGPGVANYDWNLAGLTAGGSYKIRVYTDNNASRVTFNICFLAGPSNDDCANATPLTPLAGVNPCTFTPGVFDGSTLQATASTQTSGDGTGKDDDVWFQFTTGSTPKAYTATISNETYNTGSGSPVIELWQTCGDATFVNWFPFSSVANLGTLSVNTTYKLRVYTYGTSSRFNGFNICVSYTTPPPANDVSFSATTVNLSNASSCNNIVTGGTTEGATPDNIPTCSGAPSLSTANDVWYKFTATTSTATIKITNKVLLAGTSNLMWLQIFESSNTNPKLCVDNNIADSVVFDGSAANKTLTPGNLYYIRIYNDDPASASSFNICNYLPKGPSYDECSFAVNLLKSSDENCNNSVRLTNVNATTSSIATPSCVANVYNDIWIKFVAPTPATNLRFFIQNFSLVTGNNPNLQYAVYSGTCASLTYVSCDELPTLTAGETYYVRIFSAFGSGTGNFDVCLSSLPTALTNTTCSSAVTLVATANQSASFVQGTTYGLPVLNTITDCFATTGSPNKVLWYKFVATATSHFVEFSDMIQLDINGNGLGFRVTTGTCPSTTPLASPVCIGGVFYQNQIISGLTIGQTYFIEVMENTFNGGAVSFKLRVIGASAPANDEAIGSTLLIQNPTCSSVNGSYKFSTLSANVPATLGGPAYTQDVWYKFQAAATTATITLAGRLAQPRIALYNSTGTTLIDVGAEAFTYTTTGLTVGAFYTIRILNSLASSGVNPQADFSMCVSGVPSTTLAIGPTPIGCLTNDNVVTSTNSNTWLHFTRGGNLIASVLDGAVMGTMTAKYYINTGAIRSNAGAEYLDRNLEITPTTQPTTPITVRLYFTKTEFDAFVAANDGDGNDAYWLNDLKVAKFSGLACQNVIAGTGEEMLGIARYGSLSTSVYYLDVVVPSFSGFYFKNVGVGVVVPTVCNDFTYKLLDNKVQLIFSTKSEINTSYYEIERSTDGIHFSLLSSINANNNIQGNSYSYLDATIKPNTIFYYRLKQIDKDGKYAFVCNTIKINTSSKAEIFSNAYPNPVKNVLVMDITKSYIGKAEIQIINTLGQVVMSQSFIIQPFDSQIKIKTQQLQKGTYSVRIITNEGVQVQQISKF